MESFELPGDVWNEKFNRDVIRSVFPNIRKSNNRRRETKMRSSEFARKIFCFLKSEGETFGFYPAKLDVSFSYSRRLCSRAQFDKRLCDNFCIFRNNPKLLRFHNCREDPQEVCPLIFVNCGFIVPCNEIKDQFPFLTGNERVLSKNC